MSRKTKGRLPAFVPLYKETMKTPAWLTMSLGARNLFVLLKWHYNTKLQNHVFISFRDAAKQLGIDKSYVGGLFHELEHYGFIVMVKPGGLGVEGRGRAPHWRLTEEWYLGKAPTRDFLNWTGEVFSKPRRRRKKSVWPVRHGSDSLYATGCTVTENIPKKTWQPVRHGSDIYGPKPVRHVADITSLTTPFAERELRTDASEDVVVPIGDTAGKLRWSKPQPIEITDPGVMQRFRLGPRCA